MTLTEYAQREGLGVYSRLARATGFSLRTVLRYARDGLPARHETAERLAAATDGACTVDEIRFPKDTGAKPPRRPNFRVISRRKSAKSKRGTR